MTTDIQALEHAWRQAVEADDANRGEELVVAILREHPQTTLAAEIRYQRGVFLLQAEDGNTPEAQQAAKVEFEKGSVGGESTEPWYVLNQTMLATCHYRLKENPQAIKVLQEVLRLRPHRQTGLGAYAILIHILEEIEDTSLKSVNNQRLSYARALVRGAKDEEKHFVSFLLAQLLLRHKDYFQEGIKMIHELYALGPQTLGDDLFHGVEQAKADLPVQ